MKFGANHVWNTLLFLAGAVTIWLGANFLASGFMYSKFSNISEGTCIEWRVICIKEEKYKVSVNYKFDLYDQTHYGQYLYPKPNYKTEAAAVDAMEKMRRDDVEVWYLPRVNQRPISILEHKFPTGEFIRFAAALGVFLYFIFFKRYL